MRQLEPEVDGILESAVVVVMISKRHARECAGERRRRRGRQGASERAVIERQTSRQTAVHDGDQAWTGWARSSACFFSRRGCVEMVRVRRSLKPQEAPGSTWRRRTGIDLVGAQSRIIHGVDTGRCKLVEVETGEARRRRSWRRFPSA